MSQATITDRSYVNSNLFSGHYLDERVSEREEWECDEVAREALADLQTLYELEGAVVEGHGEDALIDNWIDEVLEILGFGTQKEATLPDGGGYVDELLFYDEATRRDAAAVYLDSEDMADLFERGIGLVEAKQWDASFDERFSEQRPYRNASHQVKHYLENTPENIQWGVLTNGRKWRLYGTKDYETQTYYEVDLPELVQEGDLEAFKYFYVFFRPDAFRESAGTTFLDEVWSESETASQELGEDLQDNVFTALRVLGRGFVETNDLDIDPADEDALDELKEQSLVLLYRLMFVLYAEARGLIHPAGPAAVDEYEENFSLDGLRLDVHDAIGEVDEGFDDEFSEHSTAMWSRLSDLFRLIDEGEASLGIPPYNGGLFDREEHAFLTDHEVSNRHLAEVIYRLSTTQNGDGRYVLADYADLDTRHLGSVYEGLLEHQFRIAPEQYAAVAEDGGQVWQPATEVSVADAVETVPAGGLYVVNDEGERKATGAYYTPDYVVTYIVEETVGPLVEEIREDLLEQGFERGTQEYLGPFLQRVTGLKILDPAMGSGHFLTKATGFLAEQVMAEVREVEAELGVAFDEQHVRREIAKECIYGVDLNGMAVELAKLSMWLETLAADRPLAFLDHHFKQGNSLVGSDIESIEELESDAGGDGEQSALAEFGATREGTIDRLMDIYGEFLALENETVEDVREMKRRYAEIEQDELRRRLVAMANVHTAERFGVDVPGGAYEQMARALEDDGEWTEVAENTWFKQVQSLADQRSFHHWKLSFPEAYYENDGSRLAQQGFDAVFGNPPYGMVSDEDLQNYFSKTYETTEGRIENFKLFIEKAVNLTTPGGYHSFISSSTLLSNQFAAKLRGLLLRETSLYSIVTFDSPVFSDPTVHACVYVLENENVEEDYKITVLDGIDDPNYVDSKEERAVSRDAYLSDKYNMITLIGSKTESDIWYMLQDQGIPLGKVAHIRQCIKTGNNDKYLKIFSDEPEDPWKPVLTGSDIHRFDVNWPNRYLKYGSWLARNWKNKDFYEREKIAIRETSDRITAALCGDQYYLLSTLYSVYFKDEASSDLDLRSLLAVINSNAAQFFMYHLVFGLTEGAFTKARTNHLERLPIPSDSESGVEISRESHNELAQLSEQIAQYKDSLSSINQNLFDYIRPFSDGSRLGDTGSYQPPSGVSQSLLAATSEEHNSLRIGSVRCDREGTDSVSMRVTARYKPEDDDSDQIDQWGYTETDPIPAMQLTDLTETEADLVEAFVPVAVEKGDGFANFRETATKTMSLIDRLEALTLPDPDDVAEDLERYLDAVERAEELDEKIKRTDDLIDEIVYELYGLTDEEIEIVEEAVAGD